MMKKAFLLVASIIVLSCIFTGCSIYYNSDNVTSIEFDKTEINMVVGERILINPTVYTTGDESFSLRWSTSDPSVASVKNGLIIAKSEGVSIVTATSTSGEYAICVVRVIESDRGGIFDGLKDYIDNSTSNLSPNYYTLGMGIVTSFEDGAARVNSTVAAVVLDKNGKIVACRLDAVQCKATINEDGTFTIGNLKSKMELGDEYGLSAALNYGMDWNGDGVVKEWYDQAKAFEAFVVGMTADEVAAMTTQVVEGRGYVISDNADLLAAGCTIQIGEFKEAVVKACKDEQYVSFKANDFTLGVAIDSYDGGSWDATYDSDGKLNLYSDFAASVVVGGKIVASINDAVQPYISFDYTGMITGTSFKATKRELKEGYNMAKFGHSLVGNETVVEWYLQSAAFSSHVVGMTADDVKGMATQTMDNGYIISNDEALLGAGCTMSIDAIKAVVAESIYNAR